MLSGDFSTYDDALDTPKWQMAVFFFYTYQALVYFILINILLTLLLFIQSFHNSASWSCSRCDRCTLSILLEVHIISQESQREIISPIKRHLPFSVLPPSRRKHSTAQLATISVKLHAKCSLLLHVH